MKYRSLMLAACAATALGVTVAEAAPAATGVVAQATQPSSNIIEVQYRRGGYGGRGFVGRGYGGRGWGYGGIAAGVVAGALIYDYAYRPRPGYYYDTYDYVGPYYYPADYHGDPRTICARNFKSFEWRTGLYTTYGGEKRLCPYLRED